MQETVKKLVSDAYELELLKDFHSGSHQQQQDTGDQMARIRSTLGSIRHGKTPHLGLNSTN